MQGLNNQLAVAKESVSDKEQEIRRLKALARQLEGSRCACVPPLPLPGTLAETCSRWCLVGYCIVFVAEADTDAGVVANPVPCSVSRPECLRLGLSRDSSFRTLIMSLRNS